MKTSKIVLIVVCLVFLQSCTFYNRASVSLEKATNKGKVKVVTKYGSTFLFDEIEEKDSVYYGTLSDVKADSAIRIFPNDISKINMESKWSSNYYQNKISTYYKERNSNSFNNRIFITVGFTPLMPDLLGTGFDSFIIPFSSYDNYSSYSINYERQFKSYSYLSGRLSYGNSFWVGNWNETPEPYKKRSIYMASLCFISHKNSSHLEVNIGYTLMKLSSYIDTDSYGNTGPYVTHKANTVHNLAFEVGYRFTKGPFVFRNGVGWPYGRYISLGYAF